MKIVLNGVETVNKGAELMLYAILQEIERRFPDATVMLPNVNILQGYNYIKTNLNFKDFPISKKIKFLRKYHIVGLLKKLNLPYLKYTEFRRIKDVDFFIDGSGFTFSDQWHHGKFAYDIWKYRLNYYKENGTHIIFLPQAFGPIENKITQKLIDIVSKTASLIYSREKKSYNFLKAANVDMKKVRLCTDFTSLVEGTLPERYRHLQGRICIIPNLRLIDKGMITQEVYLQLMQSIITYINSKGFKTFLLNHEGKGDEQLCYRIKEKANDTEIVSGLNALEVKGVISMSYMCITSRFHGLASALNSGVPSIAIGWSHKYEELFKDYNISGYMVDLNNSNEIYEKIDWLIDIDNNNCIRRNLNYIKPTIQKQVHDMWNEIWNLNANHH